MLVDPTEPMQRTYEFLTEIEDKIIEKLVPGAKFNKVYEQVGLRLAACLTLHSGPFLSFTPFSLISLSLSSSVFFFSCGHVTL